MSATKVRSYGGNVVASDAYFVKLNYNDYRTITVAAGATSQYVYRGNDCFDPNFTGIGTQPTGYDQLLQIYNKCTVLGSKIDWEITAPSSGAGPLYPCTFYLYPSNVATLVGLYQDQPGVKLGMLPCSPSAGPLMKRVRSYCGTAKIFGLNKRAIVDVVNYSCTAGNSPATDQQWFWQLGLDNTLDGTNTRQWSYRIRITYYCKFWERQTLIGS